MVDVPVLRAFLAAVLALAFDTEVCDGDVVYGAGHLVDTGFDLETAMLLSLLCDAPAQEGDALPVGTPRRGFWADALESDGQSLGSRLWLLEDALATEETASRARTYAAEAVQWMLTAGYVREFDYQTEVGDEAVELVVIATTKDGSTVPFGPFDVTSKAAS